MGSLPDTNRRSRSAIPKRRSGLRQPELRTSSNTHSWTVPLSGSVSVHCSAVTGRLRVRRWGGDGTYTDAAASDHESGVGGVNKWPEAA
jgi:hypothetical protein